MMYLFPFDKINRDDNIIIYGAGTVGRWYLTQLRTMEYCRVVAVADQNANNYFSDSIVLISPDEICNYHYDKILIAIRNKKIAADIKDDLREKYKVPDEKIIVSFPQSISPMLVDSLIVEKGEPVSSQNGCEIKIAILIGYGLGDDIIEKKFIVEFYNHVKQSACSIDLCVPQQGMKYAKAIFSDCHFVGNVIVRKERGLVSNYDVVIEVGYFIRFLKCDLGYIHRIADEYTYQFFKRLREAVQSYGLTGDLPLENGIHFARSRLLHRNCYTSYNYGDFFHISDIDVSIPILSEYEKSYKRLDLPQHYITINFGWGINVNERDKLPNKIWPSSYYEEFVEMFHEAFEEIKIIQVGGGGCLNIRGVDRYIMDIDIEITKYVLRNAMFHLDCEGGLVHLATQLGTRCVVLFGPTPVHYFGYESNINIFAGNCHDCCYLEADFSHCLRGLSPSECMQAVTPELVMRHVKKLMENML